MDHKTLTIVPIVVTLAVILFLGANIGLIASVSGKQPADPTNFGPNCVGCTTTQNIANGAITHTKIAPHSVDQTQLTFAIHNGTNGAQGPQGPQGIQGPPGNVVIPTGKVYVWFAVWPGYNDPGLRPMNFAAKVSDGVTPSDSEAPSNQTYSSLCSTVTIYPIGGGAWNIPKPSGVIGDGYCAPVSMPTNFAKYFTLGWGTYNITLVNTSPLLETHYNVTYGGHNTGSYGTNACAVVINPNQSNLCVINIIAKQQSP